MARSASGPTELGAALHSVQDAFSHAHYKWPLGHGLDNLAGNSPDNTARDPNKAMVMAEWTFKVLGGDPEELDREFLEVLFSVESMEDRREMLEEAVKGGSSDGMHFLVTDGELPSKIGDHYLEQGYTVWIDGVIYAGQ